MKCLICEHESPNFRGLGNHIKNWIDSNFKIRHDY